MATPGGDREPEASGQSIFWALAAIILNAMMQPSFCGYVFGGDGFEGSLWPHRSSSFICLLDSAAEIWIGIQHYRGSDEFSHDDKFARSSSVAMRLAIFVLGVFPQAVKLFGMRGIPVTQFLAAAFLLSSVVSMVRTLRVEQPQKDILRLIAQLNTQEKISTAKAIISVIGWGTHLVAMFLIWYWIPNNAVIRASENVVDLFQLISLIGIMIISLYIFQHTAFMLLGMKPPIPRYPVLILLFWTNFLGIPDLLTPLEKRKAKNGWQHAAAMLLSVALCSYCVAHLLDFLAKLLLKPSRAPPVDEIDNSVLPTTSFGTTTDIEMQQSGVIQSQNIGNMDDREEYVAQASTVQGEPHPAFQGEQTLSENPPPYSETPFREADGTGVSDRQTQPVPSSSEGQTVYAIPPPRSNTESPVDIESIRAPSALNAADQIDTAAMPQNQSILQPPRGTESDGGPTDANGTGSPTTSGSSPRGASVAKNDDISLLGNIVLYVTVGIALPIILILWYGNFDLFKEKDPQGEAEQGTASPQLQEDETPGLSTPEQDSPPPTFRQKIWRIVAILNWPFRVLVHWIIILQWRFVLSVISLMVYTINWMKMKVDHYSKDILMVAFGIANFATGVVYFLALFDGKGTVNPGWTSILG